MDEIVITIQSYVMLLVTARPLPHLSLYLQIMVLLPIFRNKAIIDLSVALSQLEFLPTEVGKLWKAIHVIAKHKQMATVCNVTQLFKNSAEFVGNKATNHGRCFMHGAINLYVM